MNHQTDRAMRQRLRRAFAEPPLPEGVRPLLVLWRFPHLEACNQSWTFLACPGSSAGVLRMATWDRFAEVPGDAEPVMEIADCGLEPEELIEAVRVFDSMEIRGDQRGGIYDGSHYGREAYDESTGAATGSQEWIHGNTWGAIEGALSAALRRKMRWVAVPYQCECS